MLGFFNFFFVQWTFYRLAEVIDKKSGQHIDWIWLGPVWPLTGWWFGPPYKFIGVKGKKK